MTIGNARTSPRVLVIDFDGLPDDEAAEIAIGRSIDGPTTLTPFGPAA